MVPEENYIILNNKGKVFYDCCKKYRLMFVNQAFEYNYKNIERLYGIKPPELKHIHEPVKHLELPFIFYYRYVAKTNINRDLIFGIKRGQPDIRFWSAELKICVWRLFSH